jgi:DnaJ-class molecular chaperone
MAAEEYFVIKFAQCKRCEGEGQLPIKKNRSSCAQIPTKCTTCKGKGKVKEYVPLSQAFNVEDKR